MSVPDLIIISIVANLLAAIVIGFIKWTNKRYLVFFGKRDPRFFPALILLVCLPWAGINIALFYSLGINALFVALAFLGTSLLVGYVVWRELHTFWSVGIRGADQKIRKGIAYKDALRMCKNELSVLGTGAGKLTREEEFEKALHRCRKDRPIRFLLAKPTYENLIDAAQQAGRDKDEYSHIVVESLKKIADFKRRRKLNIEVRFYPDRPKYEPVFRLFFIDNAICLVSYNVYGKGDGSQLPQLHLRKETTGKRIVGSFYYAFEVYFNWLWEQSEVWDFESYLENNG